MAMNLSPGHWLPGYSADNAGITISLPGVFDAGGAELEGGASHGRQS